MYEICDEHVNQALVGKKVKVNSSAFIPYGSIGTVTEILVKHIHKNAELFYNYIITIKFDEPIYIGGMDIVNDTYRIGIRSKQFASGIFVLN